MTTTVYLQEQLRTLKTPEPKREPKKLKLPPSKVIEDVVRFLEGRRSQVSRQELETTIYAAWQKVDKEKANRLAVSRYIDRYEGVLWKKLNNGHYCLLVSSDQVITRIRDYVLELKQAKKNGQGQTSADGNGSLGSTSLPTNGNGKYDIEKIIHTLQKEGKVFVPPQFVHEIVRELKRAGLSVSYWTTTGLIELAGGDDEIPF
jgi:predicted nucleic-acid-binding protein